MFVSFSCPVRGRDFWNCVDKLSERFMDAVAPRDVHAGRPYSFSSASLICCLMATQLLLFGLDRGWMERLCSLCTLFLWYLASGVLSFWTDVEYTGCCIEGKPFRGVNYLYVSFF